MPEWIGAVWDRDDRRTTGAGRPINDEMRQSLADFDPVRFTALNEAFHRQLTDVCPNQVLGDVIDTCWKR